MKKYRLPLLAFLLATSHTHAAVALVDGLFGYYDFESDFSNKADDLGSTATSTFVNGISLLSAPAAQSGGIAGNAMRATSPTTTTSQGMKVDIGFGGSATTPDLGNNFTISAWYKLDNPPFANTANRWFVFESEVSFDLSYGIQNLSLGNGALDSQVFTQNGATGGTGNLNSVNIPDAGSVDTWHHVLLTYTTSGSNTEIKTYIDGSILGNTLVLPTANVSDTGINFGRARDGGSTNNRGFDGLIDEVALWNRSLNSDEISAVYSLGLAGQAIPEPSLLLLSGLGLIALLRRRPQ